LTTALPRTANRLARVVTVAGAVAAAVLAAAEYASGVERGVQVSALAIFELVLLTPFVVAWLGLRFRPRSIPLSAALGFASGLGLCAHSEVLYRDNSVLGYLFVFVPFVQLGVCLLAIAFSWLHGVARGRAPD
jgi:hypothetical protein